MTRIKNTLLYAGYSSDEFEAMMPDANRENVATLMYSSLLSTLIFLILASASLNKNGFMGENLGYYIQLAAFNGMIYGFAKLLLPKRPWLVLPLSYIFLAGLYTVSIELTILHSDRPAVTIIAVMLLSPFLFVDRPLWIMLMNITATIALCELSFAFKDPALAMDDMWNSVSFCVVSVAAAVFQRRNRFRSLSQAHRIRYLSETDLLTGVKNRNIFERRMGIFGERCERALTCVYTDVNGLHSLNDTMGHKAGDLMLKTVAQALIDRFGAEEVYRIGGDEFIVFVPDTPREALEQDMRRISQELFQKGYSVSVGVASADREALDIEKLMADAEVIMYAEKQKYYELPGHDRRKM